jgi:transmembrane sensor
MSSDTEPTRAEREASEWLVMLDSPGVPQAEIERFQAWLAASDENKAAYAAMSSTWDKLGPVLASLHREPSPLSAANDRDGPIAARRSPRGMQWATGAIGAAVLAFALVFAPLPDFSDLQPSTAYATEVREVRTIDLADRSSMQLSPLAAARISLNGRERRVRLARGVAYFQVADDPRPFVVSTRFGDVVAHARAFVVRIDASEAVVTVLDGTAFVEAPRGGSLLARLISKPAREVQQGQEAMLNAHVRDVEALDAEGVAARLAWRDGHIALSQARLEDAALEVTRFSGVRFVFAHPALAELRVSGYFDGGDVGAFLRALNANLGVAAAHNGDEITLSLKNRRDS